MREEQMHLLLRELGGLMGLSDLAFEAGNTCTLALETGIVVTIGMDAPAAALTVFCCLDELDARGNAPMMQAMLEANYPGTALDGATLAMAPLTGLVVISRTLSAEGLDANALMTKLGSFIDVAEACRSRFGAIAAGTAPATTDLLPHLFTMV